MSFQKQRGPSESKYWHFRVNDLSKEQYNKLVNMEDTEWIVIGDIEKENEKGTHYHTVVKFERSVRRAFALKKMLFNSDLVRDKDYYLETKYTKATVLQFIEYAVKSGIRYDTYHLEDNNEEEDALAREVEKPKLSKLELNKMRLKMAREGNEDWFLENDFDFMLGNKYPKLMTLSQPDETMTLDGELKNYWVYGPSGTCKSASIHHIWPNAYSKVVSNSKWDNYQNTNPGHKVVHIEEVDDFEDIKEGLEGLAGLKRMADRYPFPVRFNYGSRNLMIRPTTFVITSNFSINQILRGPDKYGHTIRGIETQLTALQRKFKVMHIDSFKELFGLQNKYDKDGRLCGVEWKPVDCGSVKPEITSSTSSSVALATTVEHSADDVAL